MVREASAQKSVQIGGLCSRIRTRATTPRVTPTIRKSTAALQANMTLRSSRVGLLSTVTRSFAAAPAGSAGYSSRTMRASPISRNRSLGSRRRQRRNIVRMLAGITGGSAAQSGSPRNTAASVSLMSSASNARFRVSISYSTHPNAQMSLRLSAGRPLACSGLMYAAVPRMTPIRVIAGLVIVGDCETSPTMADRFHRLSEAKVQNLDRAVVAHFDVRRLQITMDDPLIVSGLDGVRNLFGDVQCLM